MLQLIIRNQINITELNKTKNKELFKLLNDLNITNIEKMHEYKSKNKILLEKIYNICEKLNKFN